MWGWSGSARMCMRGDGEQGCITITDNDLIEKSNLNRQFLFRPEHIQVSELMLRICVRTLV